MGSQVNWQCTLLDFPGARDRVQLLKSTGLEERESVKTQFGDAQVSLGFPGTEDNSRKARLKRKGKQKRRLKCKGESRIVRCLHGANMWRESDAIVQKGKQREWSYVVQGNPAEQRMPRKWSVGETEHKTGHPIAEAQGAEWKPSVAFGREMPEEFCDGDEVRAFGAGTEEHWRVWRHIEASFLPDAQN
ncbi:hypothetical protein EDB86DRAFT_2835330 [Lactarius hatsudake]|nr:hypothetical protein EDB86DRAFT_2835330 [Lactarius hatsudake]